MKPILKDAKKLAALHCLGVISFGIFVCLVIWFLTDYKVNLYWTKAFRHSLIVPWQLVTITVVSGIGVLLPRYGELDDAANVGLNIFFIYGSTFLFIFALAASTSIPGLWVPFGAIASICFFASLFHFLKSISVRVMRKHRATEIRNIVR